LDRSDKHSVNVYNNRFFEIESEHSLVKNFLHRDTVRKFLIFNRRPRAHRVLLHSYINSSPRLKDQTYTGIGKDPNIKNYLHILGKSDNPIAGKKRMRNYIEDNLEQYENKGFELDVDLDINQANYMPYSYYYNTLISVVTETETMPDSIFFTEKIFKPIVGLHPFILFGNPHSLSKLKEYGYKTFSDYWDESYDQEEDLYKRFNKIVNLIEELSVIPLEELKKMYFSMSDILNHNYSNLVFNNRQTKLFDQLTDFPKKVI